MAYPAKLFMQREEELPDPNVDPIGYAEALQRREAARSVAAAGPASLDPLEAAAAPIAADPMLDAPPVADIPAPNMEQPVEMPEQQPEVAAVQMAPARPDRNDHVARAMRIHGPNWGRFVAQAQLGGGRRTPQSIAAESLLNDMSPEWRQLVNAHLLTGGLGRATTPLDVAVQQAEVQNARELQLLRNQGVMDAEGVRAGVRREEVAAQREGRDADRDVAIRKMDQEAEQWEAEHGAKKRDRDEDRETAVTEKEKDRGLQRDLAGLKTQQEDPRITDAKAAAANASARAADPTGAGIEDLIAGKFTPEALKELDRLAELYDTGDENAGALWWSPFSGVGGMSDGDESNLRGYLIGLGVPADVAASGARRAADNRRMFRSDKRGPLPPGAARPRE